jgi:hypothetical protein
MRKQPEVSFEEVSREFDKRISGTDKLRADQLQRLILVRQAKAKALQREEARLTKKLGGKHRRVADISARRNLNTLLVRDLNFEVTRARTAVPQVDAKTWVVFGFVRDKDLNGVPNLTVALYDQKGKWIEELGYACTNKDGSFKLETQNFAQVKPPVFLNVLTGQAVRLHADQVPLTPRAGGLDYREIILSENAQACHPPVIDRNVPVSEQGAWVVRGRVSDAQGKGLSGVTVSLFDKDLFFDDRLGETQTDDRGDYTFTYHVEDFRDLIERKPDIYLKVIDQKGKTIYTSKDTISYEAGRVETINITVGSKEKT